MNLIQQMFSLNVIKNADNMLDPGQKISITILKNEFGSLLDGKNNVYFLKDDDLGLYLEITDQLLAKKITSTFSDKTKRNILNSVTAQMTKEQIIDFCDIPFSSGYRKLNQLIVDGFLIHSGYVKKTKRIKLYENLIPKADITILSNFIKVKIKINMNVVFKLQKKDDDTS